MAKNPKDNQTKVTRIKASDLKPSEAVEIKDVQPVKRVKKTNATEDKKRFWLIRMFVAIGTYFKGAWTELRAVRWPNRRATWGLTAAVLVFTAFFVLVILLLDALFKELFSLILK